MSRFDDLSRRLHEREMLRLLMVQERSTERVRQLLRLLAADLERYILRAVADEDRYFDRLARFRRNVQAVFEAYTVGEVTEARAVRRAAAMAALDAATAVTRGLNSELGLSLNVPIRPSVSRDVVAYMDRYPEGGVKLSDRIWRTNQETMAALFGRVQRGVVLGEASAKIARAIRNVLIDPDGRATEAGVIRALRTKARKARANGETDRAARLFARARAREEEMPRVGRGVYQSASANAQRVVRSESIRAYQQGAIEYAKRKRWVVAVEWVPAAGTACEICTSLAGVYEVNSAPGYPHPHCMCYVRNIADPDITGDPLPDEIRSIPDSVSGEVARREYWTRQAKRRIFAKAA